MSIWTEDLNEEELKAYYAKKEAQAQKWADSTPAKCKYCHCPTLYWELTDKWRLMTPTGGMHHCKARAKYEKNQRKDLTYPEDVV